MSDLDKSVMMMGSCMSDVETAVRYIPQPGAMSFEEWTNFRVPNNQGIANEEGLLFDPKGLPVQHVYDDVLDDGIRVRLRAMVPNVRERFHYPDDICAAWLDVEPWLEDQRWTNDFLIFENHKSSVGVYALADGEKRCRYIGMSENDIYRRFKSHVGDKHKPFRFFNALAHDVDDVWYDIKLVEKYYIWKLKPAWNIVVSNKNPLKGKNFSDVFKEPYLEMMEREYWSKAHALIKANLVPEEAIKNLLLNFAKTSTYLRGDYE